MTSEELKDLVDLEITNKTNYNSITPTDVGETIKTIIDNLRPYKVYTALLTQTGTNAPVATVLENTLGGDITFTYNSDGNFNMLSDGLFKNSKTWWQITTRDNGYIPQIDQLDEDTLNLTFNTIIQGFSLVNCMFNPNPIEIRVYN